jgi:hypothetical protein
MARVAGGVRSPLRGAEDQLVLARVQPRTIRRKLVREDRQHVDDLYTSLGLGLSDGDRSARQVYILPPERSCLPNAQTRERQGG